MIKKLLFITFVTLSINAHGAATKYPLHEALMCCDYDKAGQLIQDKIDINTKDYFGNTPLHIAVHHKINIVKMLINAGAEVNAKNIYGSTPLHRVVNTDPRECSESSVGYCPLSDQEALDDLAHFHVPLERYGFQCIRQTGAIAIALALITAGADVNAKDKDKQTPLYFAIFRNQNDIIQVLLSKRADVNTKDSSNWTPLHLAVRNGQINIAKSLITYGANAQAKNNEGKTPLDLADPKIREELEDHINKIPEIKEPDVDVD